MKLAVTGGAGFLSYHLCRLRASRYSEILALDIAPFTQEDYPAHVRCLDADVRDRARLDDALKGIDHLIHAAAALPLHPPKDIWDVNVTGTRHVLDAALQNRVSRVVYISSMSVYGVPTKHPIVETDPLVGVGPYGKSKIAAEAVCREYLQKGLWISIVRPGTFIGTGRLGVFQILYDWVRSGKRIPVIGSGGNRYQLLEVEDLVHAIALLLNAPAEQANGAFNVGAEEFGTVREDVGALCAYAGSGARVMPTPSWLVKPPLRVFEMAHLSPLYQWVYETADKDLFVSTEKIKATTGWSARFSNREALIRSYQWYLDHAKELIGTGLGHREAWKQGILALFKKIL